MDRSNNRLYRIVIEPCTQTCLLTKSDDTSWLWHSRLGHVNFQAMVLMSKKKMVKGLQEIVQPKGVCSECLMAKQVRKSFPSKSNFSTKHALELVHGDLCGPIMPATLAGNRYFFLLVDDYTRFMWVYMLKNKSDAFSVFKKFRAKVENEQNKKIGIFRTDRGGEFMSNDFNSYCEDLGITRHFTTPYTPQQNGVVERRNRTVVEMAGSYLKQMKMPSVMWAEAIRHSIYVLNRLSTRALSGQTPYEAWMGNKPDIGHIRVFGCVVHMKIPGDKTKKLDDRSLKVVNLGKESGTKAYRLYDPSHNKVYISRDVTFEEDNAWPWNNLEETDTSHGYYFSVPDVSEVENDGSENPRNEHESASNETEIDHF